MTINGDEFGLTTGQKYDVLEDDTWMGDTGASTHMTNSDEGMFGCIPANNQYIKVRSGERLQIMKKGRKHNAPCYRRMGENPSCIVQCELCSKTVA